jgi:DNA-binding response OmpR family regulator
MKKAARQSPPPALRAIESLACAVRTGPQLHRYVHWLARANGPFEDRQRATTRYREWKMRIAALDDDACQLELIRRAMESIGHACQGFSDSQEVLRELRDKGLDLLILDWTLADRQGPAVVSWVREQLDSRLPILFLVDRHGEKDMTDGLAAGADDFTVKPIRVGELQARVRALLRRIYPEWHEAELVFGPYRFCPTTRALQLRGKAVDLSHREYELARFLFQNLGRLLPREHLRQAVWGDSLEPLSRSLDTHISRLRTKLELLPANGFLLSAVYGLGYRLEAIDGDAFGPLMSTAPLPGLNR